MKITPIFSHNKNYSAKFSMPQNQQVAKVNFTGEVQKFLKLMQEAKKYGLKLTGNESFADLSKLVSDVKKKPLKRNLFQRIFIDLEFASKDNPDGPTGWGPPGAP